MRAPAASLHLQDIVVNIFVSQFTQVLQLLGLDCQGCSLEHCGDGKPYLSYILMWQRSCMCR